VLRVPPPRHEEREAEEQPSPTSWLLECLVQYLLVKRASVPTMPFPTIPSPTIVRHLGGGALRAVVAKFVINKDSSWNMMS